MRKAAGAVVAAFALGTGVMTWLGVALYASSALVSGKTSEETTRGMANQS
ncbi:MULTISPECIES: hypothetical protein [Myxococcus]|nr:MULTISPECIES: hypothetical protein [Myxococcus]NOK07076.1 hypothetical protein [Myxococcus xanthus]